MNSRCKVFLSVLVISFLMMPGVSFSTQIMIIYRDFKNKGDENQVLGVVSAYAHNVKNVEVKEFNIGEEENLKHYVESLAQKVEKKPIVLGVGDKTVSSFANLLPLKGNVTLHVCHMVTENHPHLLGKVDFIVLPVHAVGSFSKQIAQTSTRLIPTIGVVHNRQKAEITRVYHKNSAQLPSEKSYLGVILAGDAPAPQNKILMFTEKNARELARYVARILNNRHLLIINGPRTGKHNPQTTQEIKGVHREGRKDFITEAFLDELKKCNILAPHYSLFDFQFNVPTEDMNLVLGAIEVTNSEILVPGESTSMISECVDVLGTGKTIVYYNTAMNEVHNAHIKSELESGRIKFLTKGFKEIKSKKTSKENPKRNQLSAAEIIANTLLKTTVTD